MEKNVFGIHFICLISFFCHKNVNIMPNPSISKMSFLHDNYKVLAEIKNSR